MKKLIFVDDHAAELVCDNPACDYVAPPGKHTFGPHLINLPCPWCGENLLTYEDFDKTKTLHQTVNWINKWFGWLGKEAPPPDAHTTSMRYVHGVLEKKEL